MKNLSICPGVIVSLWLFISISPPAHAYGLRQYSSQNGLSNSAILSICQDSDGYMWFGSCDGLNLFDGLNIQVYKPTTENNNLSGNLIEYIHEEEKGVLWVQTNYGLDRFDTRTRTIRSFKEFKSRNFPAASGGTLYIIHEDGYLSYYNSGEEQFRKTELPGIRFEEVLDFVIDSRQNAWIFTREEKCHTYHLERKDGEVLLKPVQIFTPSEPLIACFHEGEKVYYIDKTHQFYELNLTTGKTDCMFDLQDIIRRKGEVSSVIKHHDDYYMGFKTSGLVRLKETPHSKTRYEDIDLDIKPGIFCLAKDRYQDMIWVGTDGQGVFMYYIDEYSIQSTLLSALPVPVNNPVRAVFIDTCRNLWIGTKGDGVVRVPEYDSLTSSVSTASLYQSANSLLKDNSVYTFHPGGNSLLWIGTEEGVNYYSYSEGRIKTLKEPPGEAPIRYVHDIYQQGDSVLWLATVGEGVVKAQLGGSRDHPEITSVKRFIVEEGKRGANYFFTIYPESDRVIWFGNRGYGAFRFDTLTDQYEVFRFDEEGANQTLNDVFSIIKNKEGYWFGTSFGLVKWQEGEHDFYNEANGFPNNTIHAIQEDRRNNLWLSTNQGMVKFNTSTLTYQTFNHTNELKITEFSDGAFFRDEVSGSLMFGGVNGFITIQENEYAQKEYLPSIAFNRLSIFGKEYNIYDFLREKNGNHRLELDYSQNFFSVTFTAIDYLHGNNYTYFYKLDELNANWIENGSSNSAAFTNISPGSYTLSVKYRNNITGQEGIPGRLLIRILPPWYRTRLAYSIYGILCLSFIIGIFLFSRKRYRMKKRSMMERLRQQQKEEVYESKLRFFTNITHELCTPLTLIHGPCEKLLSYTGSDPYIHKYATLIRHNADKLNQLIQELIEFRRLETGNRQPEIKEVSLSRLADQLTGAFYELAESRGITYQVEIAKEITWHTDPACLSKIINNLLSNAFKYVNPGGTIGVKVFVIHEKLQLQVTNTGKGIRKEQISEIFDRYKILDDFELQSKGMNSRNGLGLAICHSMVKLLGGEILVISEPGKETTFTVTLPLPEANSSVESVIEEDSLLPAMHFPLDLEERIGEPDRKKATLLIIDDDPSMLWFITEVFRENYNVVPINNSTEVSRYLECHQPDLIISDIMMPEVDGISIARMVRSNTLTNHIPLIHLSARITVEDQVKGIEAGADVYITKPFHVEYLEKVVRRLLQQKKDLKDYYNSALSAVELKDGQFIHKEEKEIFDKLMIIIKKNISNPELSVDLLSSSLGMSSRQLYRKVKAVTDKTPADLIREYRFSLVEKLLTTTQLSVDEILYRTGFVNRGNFFKVFSARYGTTPKRFREMRMEELFSSDKKSL